LTSPIPFPDREPERPTPEADQAEKAVLGAAILWPDALQAAQDGVRRDFFRLPRYRYVWQAIESLSARGEPVDVLTVRDELTKIGTLEDIGGVAELARLTDGVPRRSNTAHYAAMVKAAYRGRQLQEMAWWLYRQASVEAESVDDVLALAERKIRDISTSGGKQALFDGSELAKDVYERVNAAMTDGAVIGLPTGFVDLDRQCAGWHQGELVILAGRPGMGKTSFAAATAWHAATHGHPTLFASIEMTTRDVGLRLACLEARVNFQLARAGRLRELELSRMVAAIAKMEASALFLDDTIRTVTDVRRAARQVKARADRCDLVVVDYLQLMKPATEGGRRSSDSRVREIGEMTGELKALAKEMACPVIVLSQLSRACETRGGDKKPILSDLRDSGEIEQDADFVGFLYQPHRYGLGAEGEAELIVAKQRNGPICVQPLAWFGDCMRYDSLERRL
jgi:replicative DNA helicase